MSRSTDLLLLLLLLSLLFYSILVKNMFLNYGLFVFLALQPTVVVFSQPGSGL